MIHAKGMKLYLWAETVKYTVYIQNRCLSRKRQLTPFELWYGKKPNISNLRIFSSIAYVYIPEDSRQKLDAKALKRIYVGECDTQKASLIFIPTTGKTIIS